MRTTTILAIGLVLLGCSPDRSKASKVDAPLCEETCNAAWSCGGVLENDLDTCLSFCDDESDEHATYRVCIRDTECEDMPECKRYGPTGSDPPPEE